MIHVLTPTRDNPQALSTLLGAFLSQGTPAPLTFHVCDTSKRPVIFDRHLCRVFAGLQIQYSHHAEPMDVNAQRLHMLSSLQPEDVILMLDDDLLPLSGYTEYLEKAASHIQGKADVIFGVTVDLTNERGYPDYEVSSNRPSLHTFPSYAKSPKNPVEYIEACPEAEDFSATVGHMLTRAGIFKAALERAIRLLGSAYRPEIADDASATFLAREYGGKRCPWMRCWHLGNDNNNWGNPWGLKRRVVDELVSTMTPIIPASTNGTEYRNSKKGSCNADRKARVRRG